MSLYYSIIYYYIKENKKAIIVILKENQHSNGTKGNAIIGNHPSQNKMIYKLDIKSILLYSIMFVKEVKYYCYSCCTYWYTYLIKKFI